MKKSYSIGFKQLGINLSKVSSTGYTTCPKCSHTRKTALKKKQKVLRISLETGNYECFHCGIKGRVDSNEWINKEHNKQQTHKPMANTSNSEKPQIKPYRFNPLTIEAIEFLNNRGISKETAESCKVAFYKNTICFNYYLNNDVVNAKYRKIDSKFFWQHVGGEKYLYGINDIIGQETIIIVEGEFDKLALYESGVKNAVSVSQGAPNVGSDVGKKLQCLDNSIEFIKEAKKVIIFCDNDPNGQYLTKILIERFGADRCATVEIPEDCKDANDVLLKHGKEYLKKLIENAKDTPIAGVRTLDQASNKMWDIFKNGYRKGVQTGVESLNGVFSFYKMWWNLWHGIPNSGKSAYIHFLMMCMSVKHGWKWAVFSPEHFPEEDFYIDMIELLTGKKADPNKQNKLNEMEFEKAMEFVGEHFFYVYPQFDDLANSSENVLNKIKELKLSKGIDGFLIDPYNQLIRTSSESIDAYLERSLSEVDNLCNTHNLCGNIVAHPRTLYKEKGEEDYKKPSPYQIRGGSLWYDKAYVIGNVHRPFNQSDKFNTLVDVDIQKVKSHKRVGRPSIVQFHFDIQTGWYIELNGHCALDGAFEIITGAKNSQLTFSQKANISNGKDPWGDELPF